MRSVAILSLMVGVLAAQAPRPWMQGSVEKYCHSTPADVEKLRKEHPDKAEHIEVCACRSECDPTYEHAEETHGRRFMTPCAARCSPSNCNCPSPCDS